MTVEFRLGHQDHKKVEDFLAGRPSGVGAITLDTKARRVQLGAAEAALDAGVKVLYDSATERLVMPGFGLPDLAYADRVPYDVASLVGDADGRARLVEQVVASHPSPVTAVTPPHFYAVDQRGVDLNITLAEMTVHATDKPVRTTLVLGRSFAHKSSGQIAGEYADAGLLDVELRLSPLGGEDESAVKIKSVFAICDAFRARGIRLTLGQSGNIGRAAVALGHADAYSVGIGMRERVDHAATLNRQQKPPPLPRADDGEGHRGVHVAGIYLPAPSMLVTRAVGRALLANTDIRTKIGCRVGSCRESIAGPGLDPRAHYLHSRADEMRVLAEHPARWRAKAETDRLLRALEMRQLINRNHSDLLLAPLKLRTLRALLADIEREKQQRDTA